MPQFLTAGAALVAARLIALALLTDRLRVEKSLSTPVIPIVLVSVLWAIACGIAFLMHRNTSRSAMRLLALGDLLYALALAMIGLFIAPWVLVLLVGLHAIEFGERRHYVLPAALVAVAGMATIATAGHGYASWRTLSPAAIMFDAMLAAILIAELAIIGWRGRRLRQLTTEFDFAELMSINLPFAFQLDSWLSRLAGIFGGDKACLTAIALSGVEGLGQLHSNRADVGADDGDIAALLGLAQTTVATITPIARLPDTTNDRTTRDAIQAIRLFTRNAHSPGGRDSILVRTFSIGRMHGVLLIAHAMRPDAALDVLADRVDGAFVLMLQKLRSVLEARRKFLAEAREIARRDLHDGVLQTLAAIRMHLSISARDAAERDEKLGTELRRIAEIVSLEQARLRALLNTDGTPDHPVNLIDALKIGLRTISLQWNIDARMITDERVITTDRETAENIEHLVREVIANASRHSKSREVSLGLALQDDTLILTLRDYRQGGPMTLNGQSQSHAMESRSLKQRLALVNGQAYWESLSKGTLLAIHIPMIESAGL